MLELFQIKFPNINVHDPVRLLSAKYSPLIKHETFFIFLINNNHWVMVSNKSSKVSYSKWYLYDSLYREGNINAALTKLHQFIPNAFLSNANVQQQEGCNDCGLFALGFIYLIANGFDLRKIRLDQSKLRNHFDFCLQLGTLIPYILI